MNHPLLNVVALVVVAAAVFGLTLAVRHRARRLDQTDTAPWSATLSYVATAYGVLVGFSILLLFGQFADARHAVGDEATSVGTAFEQAALFPDSASRVQTSLVCYADAVVRYDWPAMRADGGAPEVDRAFSNLVRSLGPDDTASAGALHSATATNLASQIGAISTARETRLVAAEADMPLMMWVLLGGGGLFVLVLLFMVTGGAAPRVQAALVAAAAVFTIMMLLLVAALNSPFVDGPGRVSPRLMSEAAQTMRASTGAARLGACPDLGRP